MTTLNTAFILPALQQSFIDKTLGTPLSAGTVRFFHDNAQTTPKSVYELVGVNQGSYTYKDIGSVQTLSGLGTFVDENGGAILIYLWPYTGDPNDQPPSTDGDNYYIEVYSSTGVFQEDFHNIPGVPQGGVAPVGNISTSDNIISNGQFVEVDFPVTATQSSPQSFTIASGTVTTEIAPDWSVTTTGAGTVNVWQIPISGATTNIGNPAYALGISSTGFSLPIQLTQTIQAPRILASTPVSATFIAQSNGANVTLSMTYTPSITHTPQTICSGTAVGADYSVIANAAPVSITDPGVGTGSVNVSIVIPNGSSVNISCVQLCAAIDNAIVGYIQETPEREIDHLFHYWKPKLDFKPIPSMLVGWEFALNPAQFPNQTVTPPFVPTPNQTITTTPGYIWDQTICASVVGNVTVVKSASGAFSATTNNASEAFYMLQYLSSTQALETALSRLSVNLNGYCSNQTNVVVSVYLFYGNLSSTIPSLPTSIGTLAANGVFTLSAANWVKISQGLGFSNQAMLSTSSADYGFSSWDNRANSATTANFAIVVTFSCPTSGSNVLVQSISCDPGDIPTRPAPKTQDETLRECQYYYEISGGYSAIQGSYVLSGGGGGGNNSTIGFPASFQIDFQQTKRAVPNIGLFSTNTPYAGNTVYTALNYVNLSNAYTVVNDTKTLNGVGGLWTNPVVTTSVATYLPTSSAQLTTAQVSSATFFVSAADITFSYILDARLGVV
jgi:hypothetical protein